MSPDSTLLVPLGGLGEVGRNALLVETATDAVLIDCGVLVPPPPALVDAWIPDFSCLVERRGKLRAVLLTHGHDDHLGALPHLLRRHPIPVVGTPFTLALARDRLGEALPSARPSLRKVEAGEGVDLGSLRAHFLRVTHSVPDAAALALETPGGTILHTGDFKLDPAPVDARPTDEAALAAWGGRGVDLLCCDSTNAARPGAPPSERSLRPALGRLFAQTEGRAVVVTFASHAHRLQQVLEAGREAGRRTALLGPRLLAAARAARHLGHLRPAPADLVAERELGRLPRRGQTLVVAGSQGEEGSSFQRIARGLVPRHALRPGDAVIYAARLIPGHEDAVEALLERCRQQGATVWRGEEAGVHASGHGGQEDLRRMLDLTRPRHLLPLHGEPSHLDALAALGRAWGLPPESVWRAANGQGLLLRHGAVGPGPRVAAGRVAVDRGAEVPAGDPLLADREALGPGGTAWLTLWPDEGSARWGVHVRLRGVLVSSRTAEAEAETAAAVRADLARLPHPADQVLPAAEAALRRHLRRLGGRPPAVRAALRTSPGP